MVILNQWQRNLIRLLKIYPYNRMIGHLPIEVKSSSQDQNTYNDLIHWGNMMKQTNNMYQNLCWQRNLNASHRAIHPEPAPPSLHLSRSFYDRMEETQIPWQRALSSYTLSCTWIRPHSYLNHSSAFHRTTPSPSIPPSSDYIKHASRTGEPTWLNHTITGTQDPTSIIVLDSFQPSGTLPISIIYFSTRTSAFINMPLSQKILN